VLIVEDLVEKGKGEKLSPKFGYVKCVGFRRRVVVGVNIRLDL